MIQTGRPLGLHMPERVTLTFEKQNIYVDIFISYSKLHDKTFSNRALHPDQHEVQQPILTADKIKEENGAPVWHSG